VRGFREKLGITISELAKGAEMSAGMLSKMRMVHIAFAQFPAGLKQGLQVPVTSCFGLRGNPGCSFVKAGQRPDH
jgi:hypothetical protein